MTREEAIKNIKEHCYFANLIPQAKEALDMAIKALEQEPKTDILDKIRTEIAVLDDADYDYEGYYKAVTDALQIIDKYRQEG